MQNFVFQNPCKIYFGKGQEEKLGQAVKEYASKILMVYGKNSIKQNGIYDKVIASLNKYNIEVVELNGVKGNPEIDLVYKGIEICRDKNIEFILGVGGGSVIDTCKSISVGACYEKDVWDFYLRKEIPKKAIPLATVLTVVGAGSEMSCSNVITKENEKLKRDFDNPIIIPKFSILNPEFTYSVSAYQTACGSFDAISHLLERYFCSNKKTDVTDRMIEGLLTTLINFTPLAIKEPNNYDYRAELMWASTLAQNGLMNAGREGDWACHKIEHELSGEFDIVHGEGLAMIYPSWMRYVGKLRQDKIIQFGRRVFNLDLATYSPETSVLAISEKFEQFIKSIGLKTSFKSLLINDEMATEDIENIIKLAR